MKQILELILGSSAALVLVFFVGAPEARAVCSVDPCAGGVGSAFTDCDRDGITDDLECRSSGITVAGRVFPSCLSAPTDPECIDPRVPDAVVLFERAPLNSVFDQLMLSTDEIFAFGAALPIQLHVIEGTPADLPSVPQPLAITSRQSAIHIMENLAASSSCPVTQALGTISRPSSANNSPFAIVFSEAISRFVDCVHDSVSNPTPPGSQVRIDDKIRQLQHTTIHEALHAWFLGTQDNDRMGGRHTRAGTGYLLDQSTTYSTKRGVVIFDIPSSPSGATVNALAIGEHGDGTTFCEDANDLDGDGFIQSPCLPQQ